MAVPDGADARDDSARTVVVACAVNLAIAIAKGTAAVLSGSAAMYAETAHSVADTANEVLLFVGVRKSSRAEDERHPLGYGKERYFWSFLAGCGIFLIGGVLAIAEGIRTIQEQTPIDAVWLSVAVLLVSMVLEGASWLTAVRQLRAESHERGRSLRDHIRLSSDPASVTVFYEDSAAILGLLLALSALLLHEATGSAVWDGLASIAIGVLLAAVAFVLVRRNRGLLLDESVPRDVLDALEEQLRGQTWIAEVTDLDAVWIGPRRMLLLVDVRPDPGLSAAEALSAAERERALLLANELVGRVSVVVRQPDREQLGAPPEVQATPRPGTTGR